MFSKILHANDGSDHAFMGFQFATAIAKQNSAELHMVCVEEIPPMPEFIEEVREARGTAARRFHSVTQSARTLAEEQGLNLQIHVLAGHPVRAIIELSRELKADLLVIGATGHSALYELGAVPIVSFN
jgi:nucleotide-binding universal stress UspA family protein